MEGLPTRESPLEDVKKQTQLLEGLLEDLAKIHENGHGVVTNSYLNGYIQRVTQHLSFLKESVEKIENK
jgi:hypothetical protein